MSTDAYTSTCSKFERLCPRLVPKPLWGVSIAKLVRMKAGKLASLGLGVEVAEKLKNFWFSLPRGKCAVCGSKASDVDELWYYYMDAGRGVARLVSLRSLCSRCHLAKHIGRASEIGRFEEALKHLAEVNGITIQHARILLVGVYSIWEELSSINTWRVEISEGVLPEDIRVSVENALNRLLE